MFTQTLLVWASSAALMGLMWVWYLASGNPGVVDVGWVLGIWLGYLIYFIKSPRQDVFHIIILILASVWMLRLGGFLFITRILPSHIDPRYLDVKNAFNTNEALSFFFNYQLQAVLLLPIALSGYYIFQNKIPMNIVTILGLALIVTGILGEAFADQQLYHAKQAGFSGVYQDKLWAYSRHPNYFFEIITWLGFGIIGMVTSSTFMALVAPAALYLIMTYLTIPITERNSLKKRPEAYKHYMNNVPQLWPWAKV